jgi:hypothetical protein
MSLAEERREERNCIKTTAKASADSTELWG